MEISIATQQDLMTFKEEILQELHKVKKEIMEKSPKKNEVQLLKSHQVQRLLSISAATLQNLRVNGTIPYSKVGGVIFYDKNEIMQVIEHYKRNGKKKSYKPSSPMIVYHLGISVCTWYYLQPGIKQDSNAKSQLPGKK